MTRINRQTGEVQGRNDLYVTPSRMSSFQTCSLQHSFRYKTKIKPRLPAVALQFGSSVHRAISRYITEGKHSIQRYMWAEWEPWRHQELEWNVDFEAEEVKVQQAESQAKMAFDRAARSEEGSKEFLALVKEAEKKQKRAEDLRAKLPSPESLWLDYHEKGQKLVSMLGIYFFPYAGEAKSEQKIRVTINGVIIGGIIDFRGHFLGRRAVVDFKTSGRTYDDTKVALDDQLTTYFLADQELYPDDPAEIVAYIVLKTTIRPLIEVHIGERREAYQRAFINKLPIVASLMAYADPYPEPGQACSWCDFRWICLGDKEGADKNLVIPQQHKTEIYEYMGVPT